MKIANERLTMIVQTNSEKKKKQSVWKKAALFQRKNMDCETLNMQEVSPNLEFNKFKI